MSKEPNLGGAGCGCLIAFVGAATFGGTFATGIGAVVGAVIVVFGLHLALSNLLGEE